MKKDYLVEITMCARVYVELADNEQKAFEYALDQLPMSCSDLMVDSRCEEINEPRKSLERRHADFIAEYEGD